MSYSTNTFTDSAIMHIAETPPQRLPNKIRRYSKRPTGMYTKFTKCQSILEPRNPSQPQVKLNLLSSRDFKYQTVLSLTEHN